VEIETTRGMASPLYSYIRRHTSELVYRSGTAQRNYNMGDIEENFTTTFSFEHENPNIDATLK
jgi:hypothetical protein